jgi:hypothetical protein
MAWTAAEVAQVRAAVLALVTGTRVVSISYAGPPARSVSYQIADIGQLRAILAEMERSVAGTSSYRLASTRSGLGGGPGVACSCGSCCRCCP